MSLDNLLKELHAITNMKTKGDEFERLCTWFLQNDPVYSKQIKEVVINLIVCENGNVDTSKDLDISSIVLF